MKIRKNILALLLFGSLFLGCKENKEKKEISTAPVEFEKEAEIYLTKPTGDTIQQLEIEIADDDYERQTGLMYRREMEQNQGMLFIFENEEPRGFYMKNTYITLDLIFLDSNNKIVSITENAQPESMESIPSKEPAQYVLEINSGLAEAWNLEVGDSLILNRE